MEVDGVLDHARVPVEDPAPATTHPVPDASGTGFGTFAAAAQVLPSSPTPYSGTWAGLQVRSGLVVWWRGTWPGLAWPQGIITQWFSMTLPPRSSPPQTASRGYALISRLTTNRHREAVALLPR